MPTGMQAAQGEPRLDSGPAADVAAQLALPPVEHGDRVAGAHRGARRVAGELDGMPLGRQPAGRAARARAGHRWRAPLATPLKAAAIRGDAVATKAGQWKAVPIASSVQTTPG